jgi:hypothetical protein
MAWAYPMPSLDRLARQCRVSAHMLRTAPDGVRDMKFSPGANVHRKYQYIEVCNR